MESEKIARKMKTIQRRLVSCKGWKTLTQVMYRCRWNYLLLEENHFTPTKSEKKSMNANVSTEIDPEMYSKQEVPRNRNRLCLSREITLTRSGPTTLTEYFTEAYSRPYHQYYFINWKCFFSIKVLRCLLKTAKKTSFSPVKVNNSYKETF